ncbi:hypothetical protein ACHAXM_011450, partial [Skeletonema potamos]
MMEEQLNRRPSDPSKGEEDEDLRTTSSNHSSSGSLQLLTSSEQGFGHHLSGLSGRLFDDDFTRYPQSVAPSYSFAHPSIPVESVYGEQTSECHNSQEGVVSSPYSERPLFMGQHEQITELYQLIKWNSEGSGESTEGLTADPDDADDDDGDDDFENSVGLCEENYRESRTTVGGEDQIVVRGLEPPGDPPAESEQQMETIIVQSTPMKEVKSDTSELEANIHNQLALFDPTELSLPHDYNGYSHNFVTVRDEHRFLMLYTFLKRHTDQKIIIFFSTTKSTQYYSKLLQRLRFDVRAAHNGQTKEVFLSEYLEFSKQSSSGILCIPDFQNEFPIPPSCGWIIQFEPPGNPTEYIFRVGRVSVESPSVTGRALFFVTPEQFGVLSYFKAAQVKLREYEIAKISQVQKDHVALIRKDEKLRKLAREAYHAYMLAYASHSFRDVYNVHDIDQDKVALAFGFTKPPKQQVGGDDEQKGEVRKDLDNRRWRPVKSEKNANWMVSKKVSDDEQKGE